MSWATVAPCVYSGHLNWVIQGLDTDIYIFFLIEKKHIVTGKGSSHPETEFYKQKKMSG